MSESLEAPAEGSEGVVGESSAQPEVAAPQNREMRYRLERNSAREELAAAQERIQGLQRAEVERLAADALAQPADLFSLSGNGVSDYLNPDGFVDAERVAADVAAVLAERPGLRKNQPAFDPTQGTGGAPTKVEKPSWDSLFR